ncbi:hypothetical protein RJ639_030637 [Escallonia herrerae]|uniref:Reverse transcriptase Ty1/copia-type domain-containing protein n=1 Tax=Escallonia herrerae TaxID=1293975 RepID=A0AA89BE30_9ASTE|nr:hypothetical protein RJ639_030637 [Escallonia herrerae]
MIIIELKGFYFHGIRARTLNLCFCIFGAGSFCVGHQPSFPTFAQTSHLLLFASLHIISEWCDDFQNQHFLQRLLCSREQGSIGKSEVEASGTKSFPIIVQSENSSFNAGIILNETNYDMWSQIMEMYIAEKEKLSLIRGDSQPLTKKDDGYEKCELDHRDKVIMESEKDVASYRKSIQRQRYPEWWDHNRDPRKRQSNKASTAATTKTKMNGDFTAGESLTLVATGGNMDSSEPVDWEGDAPQALDVTQATEVPNQLLKQSPRAQFGRFTKSMKAFGYSQSNADHTLFIKKQGKITALIVYVDDMVVTGNDPEERKALQNYLSQEFEMKDLGSLKFFLGIEVSSSTKGIFLSQRKYILDLLQETDMSACQPADTAIEEGLKLFIEPNQVPVDKGRYQRLVGRLMYLAHTRPDLAYASSVVSQFMHNPGEQHLKAVMRILRTAKEILENVKETYSDNENTSELFEIKGLNKDLDEVRRRILGTKPLPSLREASSEVRREESRKKIMIERQGIQNSDESSALVPIEPTTKAVEPASQRKTLV